MPLKEFGNVVTAQCGTTEENEFITMDGWFGQVGKVVALEFSTFLAEEIKMPMLLVFASDFFSTKISPHFSTSAVLNSKLLVAVKNASRLPALEPDG